MDCNKWRGAKKKENMILKNLAKIVYFRIKFLVNQKLGKNFKFVTKNEYNKWCGAKKKLQKATVWRESHLLPQNDLL